MTAQSLAQICICFYALNYRNARTPTYAVFFVRKCFFEENVRKICEYQKNVVSLRRIYKVEWK